MKVFLGIYNLDGLDGQIDTLVNGVKGHGGWDVVDTVSVGNELVNSRQKSVDDVINAVNHVRDRLRGQGYGGPVVTVDTFVAAMNNPRLCDASDYCAINLHPFFDGGVDAAGAGRFVSDQVNNVRNKLADRNKRIVVTETGWPWKGTDNRRASPSPANQRTALDSIKREFGAANPNNLILFSALNDMWKKAESFTFYAEQYWGIGKY
jgi:exo-beta-1,3-glucanase (GH17 family)